MKIGFYDSGLGGVKMLNDCIDQGIKGEFYLLADTKNNPYGIKTTEEIINLSKHNIKHLITKGCKVIVLACNTLTSCALDYLQNEYKDITFIGTEPNIEEAINDNHKKILVLGTTLTIEGKLLNNKIDKLNIKDECKLLKADKLVKLIEERNFINNSNEVNNYIKDLLKDIDLNEVSHIVLGCTHFPCAKENIKSVVGNNIKIIDSSKIITNKLSNYNSNETNITIYTTDNNDTFNQRTSEILKNKSFKIENI